MEPINHADTIFQNFGFHLHHIVRGLATIALPDRHGATALSPIFKKDISPEDLPPPPSGSSALRREEKFVGSKRGAVRRTAGIRRIRIGFNNNGM